MLPSQTDLKLRCSARLASSSRPGVHIDIATSPEQAALVEGIIRIADGLGLSVVAEGVETRAQWDRLGGCDCDYGQGYLFAAPLPADRVSALLEAYRDPRLPENLSGHHALSGTRGADR